MLESTVAAIGPPDAEAMAAAREPHGRRLTVDGTAGP